MVTTPLAGATDTLGTIPTFSWVWLTMVGGMAITLLLFTLIRTLLKARDEARLIAEKLTLELKKREQFTTDVIDSLSSSIAVLDTEGIIVAVNEPWRNFAVDNCDPGATTSDLGTRYLDAIRAGNEGEDDEGAGAALHGLREVIKGEQEKFILEYPCHSPDEQRWFTMNISRLKGSRDGVVVSHTNITERKQAEEVLHEAHLELQVHHIELEMQNEELRRTQAELDSVRARYFDLYDLAPVGYLTFSNQGLILEANFAAATMLGAARSVLYKNPMSTFIFSEDQDAYYLHRKRVIEIGELHDWEMRLKRVDGSPFWAHLRAAPAHNGEYWLTLNDITESKQLDDELQQAMEIAKTANVTMSRLLRTIAHEFRTPLGLLTGSTDVLDRYWDRLTSEKRFEQTERIRSAAHHLTNLVNSVISYNQLGTVSSETHPSLLDIGVVCRAIASDVETVWGDGRECTVTLAADCGTALLDELLFRRVLENLLTNAFRYTPVGGIVSLHVHRVKNQLQMEIIDTGIGIPQEDQALIFEAFYRSRNVEGRRGLGLGLSIVNESLSQLGGTITVTSRTGEGTTMSVAIPIIDPMGHSA